LTAKVAESETIKVAALAEKAAFEEEKVKAVALVTELKALKNTWKPEGSTRFGSVDKIGDVNLDQVREIIKNKKDKYTFTAGSCWLCSVLASCDWNFNFNDYSSRNNVI